MTATTVAELVAVRAADPERLAEAVAAAARQSPYADLLPWRPASLAMGRAGIAVLCAEMDRREPGQGWDRAGHHHLAAAAAGTTPCDVSLFSGLAGVGFAAVLLAAGRPRYHRLLSTVDAAIAPVVEREAERLAVAESCAAREYDLVSGLTGIGAYLLARRQLGPGPAGGDPVGRDPEGRGRAGSGPAGGDAEDRDPEGRGRAGSGPAGDAPGRMLVRVLSALARLLAYPGHPRRWHTPAVLAAGSLRESYPGGHHNCGLAHGVAGPLALLSIGLIEGVEVPKGRAAIEASARWLTEQRTGTEGEPDWPDVVPLDPAEMLPCGEPPGRAAWCYGAPGVARSLWLAGTALDRAEWRELAARTIRAVARRPAETWWLSTPAFCHGRAGLLQMLRRFAADLADPDLAATADRLAGDLAAEFDPASVLGMRSVEPEGVLVDHPGLLDGAPGVALALLGLPGGDGRPRVGWDRMFLLS